MNTITTTAVACLLIGTGYYGIAQPGGQHHKPEATASQATSASTKTMCQQMMADNKKTMAKMMAMDDKLDVLVNKMERSTGAAKVNATSVVVKELVAQRKGMHSTMHGMEARMMTHMMQHTETGKMSDCPMMKGMMGSGK